MRLCGWVILYHYWVIGQGDKLNLDTSRLKSSFWRQVTTVRWSTLTSALQQGFGLQVHLCDVSFGGVGRAQGACVGVVRQGLGGGVRGNVQSLCAGRHFLSLNWKTCTINTSYCIISSIIYYIITISILGFHVLWYSPMKDIFYWWSLQLIIPDEWLSI